jgi:hypothetical protein
MALAVRAAASHMICISHCVAMHGSVAACVLVVTVAGLICVGKHGRL